MKWFQTSSTVLIELLQAVVVSGEIIPSSAVVCCGFMACTAASAGIGHQCPWSWSQLSQRVRMCVCLCEHPRFEVLCLFNSIFSMTQRDSKDEAGGGWWNSGSASVCQRWFPMSSRSRLRFAVVVGSLSEFSCKQISPSQVSLGAKIPFFM